MLTPKDEGIDNWFNFFNRYFFDTSYCSYALNAGIAFSKQDDLT